MRNTSPGVRKKAQRPATLRPALPEARGEVSARTLPASAPGVVGTGAEGARAIPPGRGPITLTAELRRQLEEELRRLEGRSFRARRLQVVLLSAQGIPASDIATRLDLSRFHVSRIRTRFRDGGLPALVDRGRRGRPSNVSAEMVAQVLGMFALPPPPGTSRWSLRRLARAHGLSHSSVYRILRAHGVPPYARTPTSTPAEPIA
jgi:transposase